MGDESIVNWDESIEVAYAIDAEEFHCEKQEGRAASESGFRSGTIFNTF